ncbi:MAG: hypothetical protein MJ113_06430 [Lachnospiraceae bacterium]|nr:hypothetical protein [Lachnospiraceae bacterium]
MQELTNENETDKVKLFEEDVIKVTKDPECEYPIVTRRIKAPSRMCPFCKQKTTIGLDFCEVCGVDLPEE